MATRQPAFILKARAAQTLRIAISTCCQLFITAIASPSATAAWIVSIRPIRCALMLTQRRWVEKGWRSVAVVLVMAFP